MDNKVKLETWRKKRLQERLDKLNAVFEGIGLTANEKKTLEWLAGHDQETVENIVSAVNKVKEADRNGLWSDIRG
ncbi:MAG: hypothetical protein Q4D94_14630 [Bacillota bacterium]|nr:hypothetical protein [Bacillota bacterium]